MVAVAEEFGFTPRVCQTYRAKTKGKAERFNGYLKGSFCVPLAATLKQACLRFDLTAANAHIGRWLTEVADQRLHDTTREQPAKRLQEERLALLQLPPQHGIPMLTFSHRPVPHESFQHPLSI